MKKVTMYESNDGKLFETEKEALSNDSKFALRQLLEDKAYRDMDAGDITNMILDNKAEILKHLSAIQSLESNKV